MFCKFQALDLTSDELYLGSEVRGSAYRCSVSRGASQHLDGMVAGDGGGIHDGVAEAPEPGRGSQVGRWGHQAPPELGAAG